MNFLFHLLHVNRGGLKLPWSGEISANFIIIIGYIHVAYLNDINFITLIWFVVIEYSVPEYVNILYCIPYYH